MSTLDAEPARRVRHGRSKPAVQTPWLGVDVNSWALEECRWNYKHIGIRGATRKVDLKTFRPSARTAVIAAFTINELDPEDRTRFRAEFLKHSSVGIARARRGTHRTKTNGLVERLDETNHF